TALRLVRFQRLVARFRRSTAFLCGLFLLESAVGFAASATTTRSGFRIRRLRGLLLTRSLLILSLNRLALLRIIHKLYDSQLSVIAIPTTQFDDARVAARTILVALAQLVKEPFQSSNASRARRASLRGATTRRNSLLTIARMKEA